MTDDDARALLAAYALDAVDDDERRAVEDLLARDPDAAAELAGLHAVVAAIAEADAAAPPAALRATVLEQVARTPQVTPTPQGTSTAQLTATPPVRSLRDAAPGVPASGTVPSAPTGDVPSTPTSAGGDVVPLRRRPPRVVGWGLAAAAAAVVAVAVPGVVAWQQHDRAVRAEARTDLLTDLLAEPGATVLSSPVTGGGEAVVVLTASRGAVVVDGLPALEDDRVYQVWAMRDGVPIPAGFLDRNDGAAELLEDYRAGDGVALSVEPAGGSAQPTTPPLVVLVPS